MNHEEFLTYDYFPGSHGCYSGFHSPISQGFRGIAGKRGVYGVKTFDGVLGSNIVSNRFLIRSPDSPAEPPSRADLTTGDVQNITTSRSRSAYHELFQAAVG